MAAFAGLGPAELAIIVLVILLLFGGRKLPEVARGTGRALRIFKAETKGLMDDDDDVDDDDRASGSSGSTGSRRSSTTQAPQQITPGQAYPTGDPSAPQPAATTEPLPPTHTEQ
jgi:sec-independent protein translocase protein TatA